MSSPQKDDQIREQKINEIVEKRLLHVPTEVKKRFPPILSQPSSSCYLVSSPAYLMVVLLDESDEERTKKLQQRGSDPFPGLIADSPSAKSAFRFNNSRYIQLSRNRVEDMYSLSLVKDSTLILRDHAVSIDTKELGRYEYTIKLAYLAFYGDEIDPSNVADVLDDLIASSVERWMSAENG